MYIDCSIREYVGPLPLLSPCDAKASHWLDLFVVSVPNCQIVLLSRIVDYLTTLLFASQQEQAHLDHR